MINHADDSAVLYLDNIIQTEGLGSPYKKITLQSDTNRIFQHQSGIRGVLRRYATRRASPSTGSVLTCLDLGLTRHEKVWIERDFRVVS